MHTFICPQCGKQFQHAEAGRTFCSRRCYALARTQWVESTCKRCGKKFQHKPRYHREYCSKKCSDAANAVQLVESLRRRGQPPVTLICQQCGKPFTVLACYLPRRFCSQACAGASRVGKPCDRKQAEVASFGKSGIRLDLGAYFRSRWEANYARYLRYTKRQYAYEPERFIIQLPDGSAHAYTPDFLVDGTHFVEVKGWMRTDRRQAEVIVAAQGVLPKPLVLLTKSGYRQIERNYAHQIEHWEYSGDSFPKAGPKKCAHCGKQITSVHSKAKYCSSKCAALHRTPESNANFRKAAARSQIGRKGAPRKKS